MKSKIKFLSLIAAGAIAVSGCGEDFLDQENTTSLNMATFFDSDDAISEATSTLYNYVWNSFNGKLYYSMGDGRANNITAQWSNYIKYFTNFNDDGTTEGLYNGWSALYSVVAQANNVMNNVEKYASSSISQEAKTQGVAEARFMRGLAYWYLASLWGDVVLYENTGDLVNDYVLAPHRQTDVFEFAIRDMEFAAKNLPSVSPALGKVNKYSAYAMLSRLYLSMAGVTTSGQYDGNNIKTDFNDGQRNEYYLDLAKKAAQYAIEKGPYKLMDNYADLFTIENNNCAEDIFQLQWITGTTNTIGWGCNQDITAFFGWSTLVTDETNWGGATCVSWDLYAEFHRLDTEDGIFNFHTLYGDEDPAQDSRLKPTIAEYGNVYPEMNVKNGGYIYGKTESASSNGANIKKYVVGTHDDNGVSYKQSSGINTHMMRLAEVYLNYADAALGNESTTSDATALEYFNTVRQRAGMPNVSQISYEKLRHEYRLETAFEGQYWYFLVRRAYYQQQEVVNYLNAQDRNRTYKYDEAEGKYVQSANAGSGVFTADKGRLLLQYPDTETSKNPALKTAAGQWTFADREVDEATLFD